MQAKLFFKYILIAIITIVVGLIAFDFRTSRLNYYEFKGSVKYNNLDIGTYTSGKVKEIFADEGQIVEVDADLFEIENEIITEKLAKMNPSNPNFSEPDFAELKKRVANFKIKTPYKSVVAKIYKFKGSLVKDNETLATLIPIETIRYSFEVNEDELTNNEKSDLIFLLKNDTDILMRFSETYEIKGKIKAVVPDIEDPKKKIVFIKTDTNEDLSLNTSQTFVVKIQKHNRTTIADRIYGFLKIINK